MGDEGAAAAVVTAVMAALKAVPGLSSVSDGVPIQAADAHAVIEAGPETDWGHKSGEGAEIRFAVLVRCGGEQPARARLLTEQARQALAGIGPACGGWQLVTLTLLRSRLLRTPGPNWTAASEYRARLLKGS